MSNRDFQLDVWAFGEFLGTGKRGLEALQNVLAVWWGKKRVGEDAAERRNGEVIGLVDLEICF